jgi:hypothetical protein
VNDGVEDSSTVSLIQLEEETVEQGVLALDTQKGPGPNDSYKRFLSFLNYLVCDVITQIICPLISDKQHGCVGGRSTVTNLVEFSSFVLSEMEDGVLVDAVYTDFAKAFDREDHRFLLGTCVDWKFCRSMIFGMGSYLTGRTQRIRVGDYLSETVYCHSSVPQDSHLGPLIL